MEQIDDIPSELKCLVLAAVEARKKAYAPYSNFQVGAAVQSESGLVFSGCNIENSSYAVTLCAEQVAVSMAVAAGERSLRHLALVADSPEPLSPCGICRQVLSELAPGIVVVMANLAGQVRLTSMQDIYPLPFHLTVLETASQA